MKLSIEELDEIISSLRESASSWRKPRRSKVGPLELEEFAKRHAQLSDDLVMRFEALRDSVVVDTETQP